MARSNVRYKIDTLLRMAKLTLDEHKRECLISEAEALLDDSIDNNVDRQFSNNTNSFDLYALTIDMNALDGVRAIDLYDSYLTFCKGQKIVPINISLMGQRVCEYGYKSVRCGARENNGEYHRYRYYIKEGTMDHGN